MSRFTVESNASKAYFCTLFAVQIDPALVAVDLGGPAAAIIVPGLKQGARVEITADSIPLFYQAPFVIGADCEEDARRTAYEHLLVQRSPFDGWCLHHVTVLPLSEASRIGAGVLPESELVS